MWNESNNLIKTQEFVIKGQEYMERVLGNNTFQWLVDNNTYPCVANIVDFKRDLEDGGFAVDLLLEMTVRQYDLEGNPVFPGNIIPQAQQKVIFGGKTFRISNVGQDYIGTGARLVIKGYCSTHGA